MATLLALSSSVARGHVGLGALVPVMQRLGHEVIALPTVVLSNHPGHRASSGFRVEVTQLEAMLAALDRNGWLGGIDAVVTGYLPSEAHVRFAATALAAVRTATGAPPLYICDPVLGDLPHGLYIDPAAAGALRDVLVPLAHVLTPNAFELAWLTGSGPPLRPSDAVAAAKRLPVPHVLATSVPDGDHLANVLVTPGGAHLCRVAKHDDVPHGTGDVLTAQIAARILADGGRGGQGREGIEQALLIHLGATVAATALIVDKSVGSDELALVTTAQLWEAAAPFPVTRV